MKFIDHIAEYGAESDTGNIDKSFGNHGFNREKVGYWNVGYEIPYDAKEYGFLSEFYTEDNENNNGYKPENGKT